jgi:hypothetical protein
MANTKLTARQILTKIAEFSGEEGRKILTEVVPTLNGDPDHDVPLIRRAYTELDMRISTNLTAMANSQMSVQKLLRQQKALLLAMGAYGASDETGFPEQEKQAS